MKCENILLNFPFYLPLHHSRFSLLPLLLCRKSPSVRVLGKSSSSSSTTGRKTKEEKYSEETEELLSQDSAPGSCSAESRRTPQISAAGRHHNGPVSSSGRGEGEGRWGEQKQGFIQLRRGEAAGARWMTAFFTRLSSSFIYSRLFGINTPSRFLNSDSVRLHLTIERLQIINLIAAHFMRRLTPETRTRKKRPGPGHKVQFL